MKMWSGRFRQPLDPEFEKWQRSFPYDQRLLPFELAASRAHANALEHAGVLSSEELSEIVKALGEIGRRAESSPEFLNDPEAEDVHHFVEKQLAALIGATGYKLHTGRSRNEQIATDLRLFVRESIDTLQNLIADWIEALLARAESAGSSSHARIHALAAGRARAGCALAAGVCRNVSPRRRAPCRLPQARELMSAGIGRRRRSHAHSQSSSDGRGAGL